MKPKCRCRPEFAECCSYCYYLEVEQGYPEAENGTELGWKAMKDLKEYFEVQQGYSEPKNETEIIDGILTANTKVLIKNQPDYVNIDESLQGKKNDAGKPSVTLIPAEYIEGTAAVFNFGGQKYGRNNFRKGLAHSRCLDAAFRHLLAISRGESLDPESGLPHVYHLSCSIAMYDYNRIHHPDLNDLYELKKNEKV